MNTRHPAVIIAAVVVGIALIAVGIVYWVEPAKSLPSFFPGHEAGSGHHHVKHGIAAFLRRGCAPRLCLVPDGQARGHRHNVILASASEPITYLQAIILGLLQGVTELFPISSLGHSVIFPQLFGWDIHQNDDYFITFLVATHLATAIVLFLFFWRDWMRILRGLGRSLRDRGIGADDCGREARPGCSSSARSRPGSSACCSSTRCATCSRRRNRRRSS